MPAPMPSVLRRLWHRFVWIETVEVEGSVLVLAWGILRLRVRVELQFLAVPLALAPAPAVPHPNGSDSGESEPTEAPGEPGSQQES